jgi:ABC-type nitrate/sulfonate/bicarbonate transport system substrate-binding protein
VLLRSKWWAAALATALLAGCGGEEQESAGGGGGGEELTKIQVASAPNVFLSGLYVAEDEGYFEEEGVDVEIVEIEAGTDSVAALVSGNAQIADVGFDDLIELAEEGERGLIMTHKILNRVTLTLVMDKDKAEELGVSRETPLKERYAALNGLRLGVTSPGAPTDKYTRYYLRQAGLNPEKDAEIIPLGGGSSLLAALESGQIDAFQISPPTPYIAENQGFGTVLIDGPAGDVKEFSDFLYTAFAANKEWAQENPEAAKGFGRALEKAMAKIEEDPDAASQQILDHLGTDDIEVTKRTLKALLPALSKDGCFEAESVKTALDTMLETQIIEEAGDPKEGVFWTNDYNACGGQ